MGHKRLPVYLQHRLLCYYEYRFEKTYFKENEILGTISGQLQQEVVMHKCRKLVENVDFFKDLPTTLLLRIVASMRQEIFMTNDVVIKANTVGDCMYFISSGTVAILTKTGREVSMLQSCFYHKQIICHLYDGDHFGEIALIVRNSLRVASVITVEACEVNRLDRIDFLNAILPYPDLLMKIEQIAYDRMMMTKEMDERIHTV
ncbi:i[[h]] channel isoform e [Holotrichia oblita]|uniref:I[[h]] channel isoform e n=2 Tax=Holotrichia oblita TaxID=644536 RepID=A0ACB9T2U8_HOLOL|nr:i[[h]] channel isoform e [Holotrichia oblita]KAI4461108.1 i[[h]] channel isoform e [Holotrichia oblita]